MTRRRSAPGREGSVMEVYIVLTADGAIHSVWLTAKSALAGSVGMAGSRVETWPIRYGPSR